MTPHRFLPWVITLVLAGPFALDRADSPAPAEAEHEPLPSEVTEEVEVRLVQVPILAQDRQGRPVTDLSAGEIVVKDQGDRREVAFLDPFVSRTPPTAGPEGEIRLYVGAPGGWDEVVTSARVEPRYLVIFIDVENDDKLRRPEARADVERFVKERLDPSYRTAVMSYDGEVHLEVTFTADREAVHAAVQRAYGRTPRPQIDLNARIRGLLRNFEDCEVGQSSPYAFRRQADETCLRTVALEYADEMRPAARDYLSALEGVVRFAGGLKGRKSVLAVSHGVAVEPTREVLEAMKAYFGNTDQVSTLQMYIMAGEGSRLDMDDLMDLALRLGVTLHFIDRNSAPSGDFGARNSSGFQPGTRPLGAAFLAPQMDLEEIATHTGGTFSHTPQDVYRGLNKAIELERGGYTLGYYVDEYLSPKRLSKVKVEATRGGVQIVHRRGYYARTASAESTFGGGIRLGTPVSLTEDGRPGEFVPFDIVADPRQLGYRTSKTAAAANLTLHFRVETTDGRPLADSYHFVNHAYPLELWEAEDIEPIVIRGWVELPPWDYRLVAVLRNADTGIGGELVETLTVPGTPGAPSGAGASQ